jgi:hypothetical protein
MLSPTTAIDGRRGRKSVALTLKSVSEFADAYGFTEAQVRWWLFNRESNGLAKYAVVKRIGRRIYIDVSAFEEWLESQQAWTGTV